MKNNTKNVSLSSITPIVFPSALDYWLGNINPAININSLNLLNWDFKTIDLPKRYNLKIDCKIAEILSRDYGFLLPVTVAAPTANNRYNTIKYKCITLSTLLPKKSFVRLSSTVYIACPELCLVQAANELSLHELVEVVCNMCGIYVIDKNNRFNQQHRLPITTISKINTYIKNSSHLNGTHKLSLAMQYVTEKSNSPIESKLATIYRLPFFHGGYGVPKFEMNFGIKLSPEDNKRFDIHEIHTDFGWKEKFLAMEYDSNMTHLDINQHIFDKQRSNIITNAGYKIFILTANDIKSLIALDHSAKILRSILGKRQYSAKYDKYAELRWKVFNDLFRNHRTSYTDSYYKK